MVSSAISLKPKLSVQLCAFPVWESSEAETYRPNHRHNNTEFLYPSLLCRRDIPGSFKASLHTDSELLGMSTCLVFVPNGRSAALHRAEAISLLCRRSFWNRRYGCRKNDLWLDMSFRILPGPPLQDQILQDETTQGLLILQIRRARRGCRSNCLYHSRTMVLQALSGWRLDCRHTPCSCRHYGRSTGASWLALLHENRNTTGHNSLFYIHQEILLPNILSGRCYILDFQPLQCMEIEGRQR